MRPFTMFVFVLTLQGVVMDLQAQSTRYTVVFTELLADPSPTRGLPASEFLELVNRGPEPVDLAGWSVSDANSRAYIRQPYILGVMEAVILCANADTSDWSAFGEVIGLSRFPSLNNEGDTLVLRNGDGQVIHAIAYRQDWHGPAAAREGGYSLEMRDISKPWQMENNWRSSTDPDGGTPGRMPQEEPVSDHRAPELVACWAESPRIIRLDFSEALPRDMQSSVIRYRLSDKHPDSVREVEPFFRSLRLYLTDSLLAGSVYRVEADDVTDLSGNRSARLSRYVGLCAEAGPGDLRINELLFDPDPDAADYVELIHTGSAAVNLRHLYLSTRDVNGRFVRVHAVSNTDLAWFPGSYLLCTTEPDAVARFYLSIDSGQFRLMPDLPSMPDDKGQVAVLNTRGEVVDEVAYHHSWHHAFLKDKEGVALEKLSPGLESSIAAHWHSASSQVRYGTPGYGNSQVYPADAEQAEFRAEPSVFSPDADGRDDFSFIRYRLPIPGMACRIHLTDARGAWIREIVPTSICSTKGEFRWDGSGNAGRRMAPGLYILVMEAFHANGSRKKMATTVVVAGK